MRSWLIRALAALGAIAVRAMTSSTTTWRLRKHERDLRARVRAPDRFVDIGVRLCVVVADPDGEELLPDKPRLRVLRSRTFGGILDTQANPPRLVAPTRNPRVWYCSEDQYPVIVHADSDPLGQLVYGSEGAGKTAALVMWLYMRWLEHLGTGAEIGITAPTNRRINLVVRELRKLWPRSWYRYRKSTKLIEFVDGCTAQIVSTHQQSTDDGSPIQGFTWVAAAGDETQDSVDAHEDIESRGRGAPRGRYKQLRTATAKDDPKWRTLRDQLDHARDGAGRELWIRRTLLGRRSPFVAAEFWEAKRGSMSAREFRRRVEAQDVGPERATYPEWSRDLNMIAVPDIGWEDVTTQELSPWGYQLAVLVGHDPGTLVDVSLLLKAYRRSAKDDRPIWVIRGEVNTEESTKDVHVMQVLETVRTRWRCNLLDRQGRPVEGGARILVRADPADPVGANDSNRPHVSVYTTWRRHGVLIHPATYSRAGDTHGRVPKNAGIEVINTLICDAAKQRRLFVERLPDGSPAAPRFVAAIETSQRDLAGKAEQQRKNAQDVSHWPAAARYALWTIERPRLKALAERIK